MRAHVHARHVNGNVNARVLWVEGCVFYRVHVHAHHCGRVHVHDYDCGRGHAHGRSHVHGHVHGHGRSHDHAHDHVRSHGVHDYALYRANASDHRR